MAAGVQPRPLRYRGRLNRRGRQQARRDNVTWLKRAFATAVATPLAERDGYVGRVRSINPDGTVDILIGRGLFAIDGGAR